MEKRLDDTDNVAKVNQTKVDSLKSMNRFFFLPTFGAKKKAERAEEKYRREQEEQKIHGKHGKERESQWQSRNERLQSYNDRMDRSSGSMRSQDRYYTTPQGLDRDEHEEEIDDNLNQISGGLSRLKMMGMAMNDELDSQSNQLGRISDRTSSARDNVNRLNQKMTYFTKK